MSECNPLLSRIKQIGAAVEATCGAGATFTAADFKFRPISISATPEIAMIENNTLSATLSPRKLAAGEKTINVQVSGNLVGSGVAGTLPEHDVFLRGCGMKSEVVVRQPIGAIASGPFVPGEVITQAVSLATGIVMQAAYTGDTHLYYYVTSGTFNASGLITGAISAATTTPSAVNAAAGHAYHPRSSGQETIALRVEEDGRFKLCHGAMGSFTISSDSSQNGVIEYSFSGKLPANGMGDAALTTGITRFSTAFPTFADALLVLERSDVDEFTPVVRSISVDMQQEAVVRKDANDVNGLIAARVTGRTPQITVTAEAMKTASFDIFTKMVNSESVSIGWRWKAPDNKVWLFGINGQLAAEADGEADGFDTTDLTFRMNGYTTTGDDELWIVFAI